MFLVSCIYAKRLGNHWVRHSQCCVPRGMKSVSPPPQGFKIRKRLVSNTPTGGPGNCPHLLEAVPCDEPRCYDWRLVSLDRCHPDDGKPCGPGTQTPQIQCVNTNGKRKRRTHRSARRRGSGLDKLCRSRSILESVIIINLCCVSKCLTWGVCVCVCVCVCV